MGAFLVNFHVKTDDVDQLRAACNQLKLKNYRIVEAEGPWTTLYEEQASSQDDNIIKRLAKGFSASLNAPCIAFLVHDSDIACYWLYDEGKLLDEFNSMPDYFDEDVSDSERKQLQGRPEVFLRYCQPGVDLDEVKNVLHGNPTFADDTIAQLAQMLGIDEELALSTYGDEEGEEFGEDFGEDDDDDDEDKPRSLKFPQAHVDSLTQQMKKQFDHLMGGAGAAGTSGEGDALVQAAAEGKLDTVKELLQQGAGVDEPGKLSTQSMSSMSSGLPINPVWSLALPPLLVAASFGKTEVVRALIQHKANIQYVHPAVGTALHMAVQGGWPETVEALLQAGVPASLPNAQGQTALTLLKLIQQQLSAAKAMLEKMPGMLKSAEKLMGQKLPEAGWAACEKLLQNK